MKKITIMIDEECIPEGYSVIEFRIPRLGDYYIGVHGALYEARGAGFTSPTIILKPLPKWPEWLRGCDFLAKDSVGDWWAFKGHCPKYFSNDGQWASVHMGTVDTGFRLDPRMRG